MPTDLNSIGDNNAAKLREMERQSDPHGAQVGLMSTSSSGSSSHERKYSAFPAQGLNKQQHMQFSQTSFPTYGSAGSGYPPFPTTSAASSTAIRPQPHDSQMRQAPSHPNLTVNHLGSISRPMNVSNMSTFDRPHSHSDPKKMPAGSLSYVNSNTGIQQHQVQWPSSTSKEQKTANSPSIAHVKQEPSDQGIEQQKAQLSASYGSSSLPPAPSKLGSAVPGNMKDEAFEIHSSRSGLTSPSTLVPSNSVSSPSMETNILVLECSLVPLLLDFSLG